MGSSDRCTGRLIQDGPHNGAFNMAADVWLAQQSSRTGEIVLRLYTWEIPTLSLGYHQKLSADQLEGCRNRHVPVVRRPTGGRAVLHDRELTYAVIIPTQHPLLQTGRDGILHDLGLAFVEAARGLGLNAELVRAGSRSEDLRRGSPLCFDSISRWEVRLEGRKWIGSAQRFLPEAFLQHGSILIGRGEVDLAQLLGLPGSSANVVEAEISALDLRRTIPPALGKRWDIAWQEDDFTPAEVEEISRLIEIRESSEAR